MLKSILIEPFKVALLLIFGLLKTISHDFTCPLPIVVSQGFAAMSLSDILFEHLQYNASFVLEGSVRGAPYAVISCTWQDIVERNLFRSISLTQYNLVLARQIITPRR